MVYLKVFEDVGFNTILNSLLDMRFADVYKLLKLKVYEDEDKKLDFERVEDLVDVFCDVYSDKEIEKFEKNNFPKISCVLFAYNCQNWCTYERRFSVDTEEDFKKAQETYVGSEYNSIAFFNTFVELDKMRNFVKGTAREKDLEEEIKRLQACQN